MGKGGQKSETGSCGDISEGGPLLGGEALGGPPGGARATRILFNLKSVKTLTNNPASKQAPTRKTKPAVDRRQNNRAKFHKAMSVPSSIAQRSPHHAIAVPVAMQNRVTKTMSVAPPLGNN